MCFHMFKFCDLCWSRTDVNLGLYKGGSWSLNFLAVVWLLLVLIWLWKSSSRTTMLMDYVIFSFSSSDWSEELLLLVFILIISTLFLLFRWVWQAQSLFLRQILATLNSYKRIANGRKIAILKISSSITMGITKIYVRNSTNTLDNVCILSVLLSSFSFMLPMSELGIR